MPRLPLLRGFLPRLATRPLLPLTRLTPVTVSRTHPPSFFRSFYNSRPRLTSSSSTPPHSPHSSPSQAPQTLSARLKTLIKTYGWYALGMYIVLGALDFGVAFAAINLLGADQVAQFAAAIKTYFMDLIGRSPPEPSDPGKTPQSQNGAEGLYAMLLLAYTLHKTLFLPVRVGLTAAITPKFVGWLGKRGWAGTDGARRAAQHMRDRVKRGSRGSNSPSD